MRGHGAGPTRSGNLGALMVVHMRSLALFLPRNSTAGLAGARPLGQCEETVAAALAISVNPTRGDRWRASTARRESAQDHAPERRRVTRSDDAERHVVALARAGYEVKGRSSSGRARGPTTPVSVTPCSSAIRWHTVSMGSGGRAVRPRRTPPTSDALSPPSRP
jgi:hypothetical protein